MAEPFIVPLPRRHRRTHAGNYRRHNPIDMHLSFTGGQMHKNEIYATLANKIHLLTYNHSRVGVVRRK